ncbi:TTC28 [Branchiostoma lanceolatum]|uniref:TTC28 protein n=1 Tax=Branchiostoma lanceolatum TaxID=7740 RepID=A0A8K0EMK5_BRALA|nr:TTC28 [Branchiostoma lanceolatum]
MEVVQHRIKYAEKCTKLVDDKDLRLITKNPDSTTLAVSLALYEVKDKTKMKGQGMISLTEAYTRSFVTSIVDRNKSLEIESLKSLGDLYLEMGRVGREEAAFTKSVGLYRAALDRCEDSDVRETLRHRIKYAEKVKEKESKKAKKRIQTGPIRDKDGGNDNRLTSPPMSYKDHLQEGCRVLQTGDLDGAEQHFAAALKSVHVKESTSGKHWKEVEPLCKLADVYLKRGMQSGDAGDFTKAAALCNAALVRARTEDREDINQTIRNITKSFVGKVLSIKHSVPFYDINKHTKILMENRGLVQEEIKRIEQQVDPYSLDDNDPKIREVEKNRVKEIKALFDTIVNQRRKFISGLVDECMEVMGPPPCKFAMVGLGSQATGLVTPYSDLEFAILIQKETESSVNYFHNLTHYLHLKVINLGETILPALAIKSLNNFVSDNMLDNWFYDSVTPRGFSFDGAMPHACKTPLGRGKMCHLIRTPHDMTKVLVDDVRLHLKKGYHLASILGNVSLITGEQILVEEYTNAWNQQLRESGRKIATLVANAMLLENSQIFERHDLTDRMLDVKKDIYRFSSLAVSCWALVFNLQPTTIWDTIQKMHKNGIINIENVHHLMVLVSISAELRLRTYMNNGGQKENMSALLSMSATSDIAEKSEKVFYFSNTRQLMRYYYTAIPLKHFLSGLVNGQPIEPLILFDKSFRLQAEVYKSLYDNQKWKTCTERALHEEQSKYGKNAVHRDIADLLNNLGLAWKSLGDTRKAVTYHQQSLQMARTIYGTSFANADIAASLTNLGLAWGELGDHRKAVSCHEQSLHMLQSMHGGIIAHAAIVPSLCNLGTAWSELGDNRKAVSYYEQALKMMRIIYGESTAHPSIALSLVGLGNAYDHLGDQRKAVSYYEQALQMMRNIYGENTAHPKIAGSLNNLGTAWNKLGDHRKAISYYEQALKMRRRIHEESTAHPDIAASLNNLGAVWQSLGNYRKAVSYYEQSLQMRQSIYGEGIAHPDIASSLNNLGTPWSDLGDHKKAISYYEQSLQMRRAIYGERTAHPDIAASLTTLGNTWSNLGNHRKAISYHEQSLQMMRSIYGEETAHPDIASSLNNLGTIWNDLGYRRKAVGYYEQALQMMRSIRVGSTAHPVIAGILNNLGTAWHHLGDYTKGIGYLEQSMQLKRSIYGDSTAHPDIASSLNNLGGAWGQLGDHRKAVKYAEQSLQMRRRIYGEGIAHADIANSLHNLGNNWSHLGDHRKAVSYYEQALQMRRSIHGENTAHPYIVTSLNNLGNACILLGDHEKAVSYHELSLKMARNTYGESTAHPDIARSLYNLGVAWSKLGDQGKAFSYFDEAKQIKEKIGSYKS